MSDQSQIVDLSDLSNVDILESIEKMCEESQFSKFTIVLKRKPRLQGDLLNTSLGPRKKNTKYSVKSHSKCRTSEYSFKINGPFSDRNETQTEPDDNYHLGLRLYQRGQYEQALELLIEEEAVLADSLKDGANMVKEYHDICFNIGNCYYRMKNYEKAIEFFGKKFPGEEDKQKGQKYNNLGSCYAHLDQERLSLNYYTQAFKIYSQFPEFDCSNLLNNLGTLYSHAGVLDTAEKYFIQSIEQRTVKSPNSSFLMYCSYMQLGNCQMKANKLKESIESYKSAQRLTERGYGDESDVLTQLASIYEMCEKWNDALNCYEKLSFTSCRKGFLYEKAAFLHRNMGHFQDYDRFIKQAFEEYTKQRNERKLSELRPVMFKLQKK